ncbi:MAG: D-cysteine desulfhydrase family protein [Anaerolineaceae bacterium]|nr:D-cysteine desulfhydrase family protein [Anaerolineaceae bacterium]
MITDAFARIPLGHFPTPIEELRRLRQELGPNCPRLFIKRDDATGLATGGNKTRKLEFALGAALADGANHILTSGANQSNHARQTAAACARLGLRCTLVLDGEEPPKPWNGNLFLDALFGAEVVWLQGQKDAANARLQELAEQSRAAGNQPCIIPRGASNAIGAMGYVAAVEEMAAQWAELNLPLDRIICVSGSGGTHSGLLTGLAAMGLSIRIDGIQNGPRPGQEEFIKDLCDQLATRLGLDWRCDLNDIHCHSSGDHAYGVITPAERESILLLARTEGIIADPVYTGRALGGWLSRFRAGHYGAAETLLLWHTGGTAGLFARTAEIFAQTN